MDYEQILAERRDDVVLLTLNRPDRLNAWTPRMSVELVDAISQANDDDGVGAVVVTGAGRGFCAGADLEAGGSTFDYRERGVEDDVPRDGGGQFSLPPSTAPASAWASPWCCRSINSSPPKAPSCRPDS
jgi:enoyl-CoA hydratase/carnithine racemase